MPYRDYVELEPGLFLGSHPEEVDAFSLRPSAVFCLSARPSTAGAPAGHLYVHWPISDGPVPDEPVLHSVVGLACSILDRGTSVFVHCDAGLNRSALVAGAVMIARGMDPAVAVERIRTRRSGALSDTYATWLMNASASLSSERAEKDLGLDPATQRRHDESAVQTGQRN